MVICKDVTPGILTSWSWSDCRHCLPPAAAMPCAGEFLALRALSGLGTLAIEEPMPPAAFTTIVVEPMTKAALCAWWHAKIARRLQAVTVFQVGSPLVSQALQLCYQVLFMYGL